MEEIFQQVVFQLGSKDITVLTLSILLGGLIFTYVFDRLFRFLLRRSKFFGQWLKEDDHRRLWIGSIRTLIWLFGVILAFELAGIGVFNKEILRFGGEDGRPIMGHNIVVSFLVFIMARLSLWYVHRFFVQRKHKQAFQTWDKGRRMAIYQIIRYVVYVIATLFIMSNLHIDLTVLLTSTAALFVGLGLAMQDTFANVASGFLILFEGTIEVGDMVYINSLQLEGRVTDIRLRSTIIETLDSVSVIVPNAKFTASNVVNWSFNDRETRFHLKVGVAYGSDINRVKEVLIDAALRHNKVLKSPPPKVRFQDFGNSSLDFELLFWTHYAVEYEDILSDLRYTIEAEFRLQEIEIPFPQRDLHIRSGLNNTPSNQG